MKIRCLRLRTPIQMPRPQDGPGEETTNQYVDVCAQLAMGLPGVTRDYFVTQGQRDYVIEVDTEERVATISERRRPLGVQLSIDGCAWVPLSQTDAAQADAVAATIHERLMVPPTPQPNTERSRGRAVAG